MRDVATFILGFAFCVWLTQARAGELSPPRVREAKKTMGEMKKAIQDVWEGKDDAQAKYYSLVAKLAAVPQPVLDSLASGAALASLERKLLEFAIDRKKQSRAYDATHEAIDKAYGKGAGKLILHAGVDKAFQVAKYRLVWEELLLCPATRKSAFVESNVTTAGLILTGIASPRSLETLKLSYGLASGEEQHATIRAQVFDTIVSLRKAGGEPLVLGIACDCVTATRDKDEQRRLKRVLARCFAPESVKRLLKETEARARLLRELDSLNKAEGKKGKEAPRGTSTEPIPQEQLRGKADVTGDALLKRTPKSTASGD